MNLRLIFEISLLVLPRLVVCRRFSSAHTRRGSILEIDFRETPREIPIRILDNELFHRPPVDIAPRWSAANSSLRPRLVKVMGQQSINQSRGGRRSSSMSQLEFSGIGNSSGGETTK